MTVSELIDRLRQCDPDAKVLFPLLEFEDAFSEVREVVDDRAAWAQFELGGLCWQRNGNGPSEKIVRLE